MYHLMSFALLVSVVYGQCPNGYLHHGESCYAIPATPATWGQAAMYCTVLGGDLAVIDSAAEQLYIEGFLQRMAETKEGNSWAEHNKMMGSVPVHLRSTCRANIDFSVLSRWSFTEGAFPSDKDFWIGGGDFLEHGTWIWVKSQEEINPEASFWAAGQPASASQHQACLRLSQAIGYRWEAGSCDSPEYFICEKPYIIGDSGLPVGK